MTKRKPHILKLSDRELEALSAALSCGLDEFEGEGWYVREGGSDLLPKQKDELEKTMWQLDARIDKMRGKRT